jgi:hypothetical protein
MKIEQAPVSVNDIFKNKGRLENALTSVANSLPVEKLIKAMAFDKRSGHSLKNLLYFGLFFMPLSSSRGSILNFFKRLDGKHGELQPAFYRFLLNKNIAWRKVMMAGNTIMRQYFRKSFAQKTSDLPRIFSVDDTFLRKFGPKIQGVSRVHDHTDNTHQNGYKMLAIMYFNGFYSHFVDFSLHAEGKKKTLAASFRRLLGCQTEAGKRAKELLGEKPAIILQMLRRLRHFKVDYFLADSWFCSPAFMVELLSILPKGCEVLMHAKMDQTKYCYKNRQLGLKELLEKLLREEEFNRCKEFNTFYFRRKIIRDGRQYTVLFSRLRKNSKWVAFLTTDTSISYIKAMRVYALRWKIEIGFREIKQNFYITRCQANHFASQIAHITQAIMLHSFISHYLACCNGSVSMGELFREFEQELQANILRCSHWAEFKEVLIAIAESLGGIENVSVQELLESAAFLLVESMIDEIAKWPGRWNSDLVYDDQELVA